MIFFSTVPNQWLYYACYCWTVKTEAYLEPFWTAWSPQSAGLLPETPLSTTWAADIQQIPGDNANRLKSPLCLEGIYTDTAEPKFFSYAFLSNFTILGFTLSV